MRKVRILVVEDEAIVQLDIQDQLEQMGHSVVGVSAEGEDAVTKAAELKPDLVLMDVRLEGEMDGIEAGQQIGSASGIPVLYLTAYSNASFEWIQVDRFRPVLSKPFRTAELEDAIERILGEENVNASRDPGTGEHPGDTNPSSEA